MPLQHGFGGKNLEVCILARPIMILVRSELNAAFKISAREEPLGSVKARLGLTQKKGSLAWPYL